MTPAEPLLKYDDEYDYDDDAHPAIYTSEDYWGLPEGRRAELINGKLYDMTPPSRTHQLVAGHIYTELKNHVRSHGGPCEVDIAPLAVNLMANDTTWVEPDVFVVCDPGKLSDRGCAGAPDLVVEVVSPSSRQMDYIKKLGLYQRSGVREYWVVDPSGSQTAVYRFEDGDFSLGVWSFDQPCPVGIFPGLGIRMADAL